MGLSLWMIPHWPGVCCLMALANKLNIHHTIPFKQLTHQQALSSNKSIMRDYKATVAQILFHLFPSCHVPGYNSLAIRLTLNLCPLMCMLTPVNKMAFPRDEQTDIKEKGGNFGECLCYMGPVPLDLLCRVFETINTMLIRRVSRNSISLGIQFSWLSI